MKSSFAKTDKCHFENQLTEACNLFLHSAVFKAQIHLSGPNQSQTLKCGLTDIANKRKIYLCDNFLKQSYLLLQMNSSYQNSHFCKEIVFFYASRNETSIKNTKCSLINIDPDHYMLQYLQKKHADTTLLWLNTNIKKKTNLIGLWKNKTRQNIYITEISNINITFTIRSPHFQGVSHCQNGRF